MPTVVKVGFDATGGQEWALWITLVAAGIEAVQLPSAQISAREKQGVAEDVREMDIALKTMLDNQIKDLERQIENTIAQEETMATKVRLPGSISGIGPVAVAMPIAEMPELGRMTAGETAAMTGLAPIPHDSGTTRGRRRTVGGRQALRHVPFQAALAAPYDNPTLTLLAKRLKKREKPHKLVIVAIARKPVTIANAVQRDKKWLTF